MPNESGIRALEPVPGAPAAGAGLSGSYAALRSGAILVDRSARARATFRGKSAAELLTGLVTNDVLALAPGDGQYAALLSAKGKIIADVRIFAFPDHLFVDAPERAAGGFWATIRKYVNPRLAKYEDRAEPVRDLGLFGARSRAIAAAALAVDEGVLETLGDYGHRTIASPVGDVIIARVPDAGLEGYECFAAPDVTAALMSRLLAAGASVDADRAFDAARIEAGRPEWGLDVDDNTLAQEARLDELNAISYTKGCYTGQETVARVHFRGHVNRTLRGVSFDAATPPASGSELLDASARVVGESRSTAVSPRLGGIGLAMIRREVEDGTALLVGGSGRTLTVRPLPFPR